MALFKRKNKDNVLPEEVQQYYQAEKRQRTGVAWLLAFVTLLVTVLVAALLFFGGRWVYRAVFDNDTNSGSTQSQEESAEGESSSALEDVIQGASDDVEQATGSTPSTTPAPSTPAPATTPAPQSSTPPSQLVNTGPGDEL